MSVRRERVERKEERVQSEERRARRKEEGGESLEVGGVSVCAQAGDLNRRLRVVSMRLTSSINSCASRFFS